jgi:hypothetical protein
MLTTPLHRSLGKQLSGLIDHQLLSAPPPPEEPPPGSNDGGDGSGADEGAGSKVIGRVGKAGDGSSDDDEVEPRWLSSSRGFLLSFSTLASRSFRSCRHAALSRAPASLLDELRRHMQPPLQIRHPNLQRRNLSLKLGNPLGSVRATMIEKKPHSRSRSRPTKLRRITLSPMV